MVSFNITICQEQFFFRIILSLNLYHEMKIHGVVADLSMKISEYENYMTFFKQRTQWKSFIPTLCVCKNQKFLSMCKNTCLLWSQFKVRVLNRFEMHLRKNWSVSFYLFKCCVPEDSSAVVKIKLKENFYILDIYSYKGSKSYDKIMVAIFNTTIVWSGEGWGGGIRWQGQGTGECTKVISFQSHQCTVWTINAIFKKSFFMDFDTKNNSLHKSPSL